jgi:integrase
MLTNLICDQLKPKAKPYKKADAEGLYLFVTPKGFKSWRYKYAFGGKERLLVIGPYPEIKLADARIRRNDALKAISEGRDPAALKKLSVDALGERVFETVARQWVERKIAAKEKAGKALVPQYATDLVRCLETHVFPSIGRLTVDEITSRHVIGLLDKIAPARAEIVRRRLVKIFTYAAAMGLRPDTNPAIIAAEAMDEAPTGTNFPAITKLAPFVEMLEAVDAFFPAYAVQKLATRFLALTAARPAMVRFMTWNEIETNAETGRLVWTIPAAKMKMRVPFTSPLSPAAVAILEALRPISGRADYVFPSSRNARIPLCECGVVRLLQLCGYANVHVAHGFRSSFSTIMHEHHKAEADDAAIEFQLAHVIGGVKGRYNRAAYLARRTELVDEWASWITPTLVDPVELLGGNKRASAERAAA